MLSTDSPASADRNEATLADQDLDTLCVNALRFLAIDAIQKANSGHPGLPLGAAPLAYVLWTKHLRHDPSDPSWFDRDRFVLSAGHGSALLYSLLHLTGYNLGLDQLKQFRQWGSATPGHPERGITPGVEVTTGPLGQGFAMGVGMAIAEARLAALCNRPAHEIINHYTYALVSDGDLMEGVAAEAASLAGHLKLGKLIYLYDRNFMSLAGTVDLCFTEDVEKRFQAYGWHTHAVEEGNNLEAIDLSLQEAKTQCDRPSLILIRTHIGYGSPHKQDTFEVHGAPLGEEEVKLTKQNLKWPMEPPFLIPPQVQTHFRRAVDRGKKLHEEWNRRLASYGQEYPDFAREFHRMAQGQMPDAWLAKLPEFGSDTKGIATRVASGKVMNGIAGVVREFMGGSADLNPSTNTILKNLGDFQTPAKDAGNIPGSCGGVWDYAGANLHFGVREHAMGAITNGLAAHGGTIPFASTFLIFSDYLRPTLRLAALMKLGSIFVFTHDSIAVGEDGPTHQPVEHLAALRAIPNLIVLRPCDANETVAAWRMAIESRHRPVALILSRQAVPTLNRTQYARAEGLRHGAYILSDAPNGRPDLLLIASGAEVHLALQARQKLLELKIQARVVSMPSWELFDEQPPEYREFVLPGHHRARVSIEAAAPLGWHRYVGDRGAVIGVDKFGASAPGSTVLREYGFTVENVVEKALGVLGLDDASKT